MKIWTLTRRIIFDINHADYRGAYRSYRVGKLIRTDPLSDVPERSGSVAGLLLWISVPAKG